MDEVKPVGETAKEVAGKSIGRFGLFYITLIVLIGVGSSYFLSDSAITAVMTMIGGALVALNSDLAFHWCYSSVIAAPQSSQ